MLLKTAIAFLAMPESISSFARRNEIQGSEMLGFIPQSESGMSPKSVSRMFGCFLTAFFFRNSNIGLDITAWAHSGTGHGNRAKVSVTLRFKKYSRYSELWEHEHCVGWWATFMETKALPDVLTEGYATDDGRWVS